MESRDALSELRQQINQKQAESGNRLMATEATVDEKSVAGSNR